MAEKPRATPDKTLASHLATTASWNRTQKTIDAATSVSRIAALGKSDVVIPAAAEAYRTNSAAATMLSAVVTNNLSTVHKGGASISCGHQFCAVSRRIDVEGLPVSAKIQLSVVADDPAVVEATSKELGIVVVSPLSPKDRLIVLLLAGFAAMILYEFMQTGMTGDPVTPETVAGGVEAGMTTVAVIKWAPGTLKNFVVINSLDAIPASSVSGRAVDQVSLGGPSLVTTL